jgi:hypothetical protein
MLNERKQGEFREIRPLKSHYLYFTLCANKRARIRGQALTRNDSGATIVLPETRNQLRSGRWRHPGIVWMEWKKSKFQNHVCVSINQLSYDSSALNDDPYRIRAAPRIGQ